MSSSSTPWTASATISLLTFSSFPSILSKYQFHPSPSPLRLACRYQNPTKDLQFVLHDALDASGIDTSYARAAREGFCSQIRRLSDIERETSITINRGVDLGKTALHVAAEDDSLISHSSVPLPVDAFIERLDDLSMGYCSHYNSSFRSSPEYFLASLEKYLYVHKGFRRTTVRKQSEPRALYLHSVLTHRSGSAIMLSLIYSEILKMLRLWGLLNFDVEIYFPHDLYSLPRGYHKQKSKLSDQPHIMTSQSLLVEVTLIVLFIYVLFSSFSYWWSGFELASAKAAQHRLERGVWTSVRFGDMRRALSEVILSEYNASPGAVLVMFIGGLVAFHGYAGRVLYQSEKHSQEAIGFHSTNPNIRVDTLSLHFSLVHMYWRTVEYKREKRVDGKEVKTKELRNKAADMGDPRLRNQSFVNSKRFLVSDQGIEEVLSNEEGLPPIYNLFSKVVRKA
ncbi:hypothetical protein HHK36_017176 [Tetracentron sinense]|uniref:Protein SirB1 N-terminal domain-containing protein n=1 Tax=Tetracentron sinense TaxID=13715 RepID=A0A834YZ01_TETSI|nr:hypothetical protein HHK36_017176 [Tetracentron sinense]